MEASSSEAPASNGSDGSAPLPHYSAPNQESSHTSTPAPLISAPSDLSKDDYPVLIPSPPHSRNGDAPSDNDNDYVQPVDLWGQQPLVSQHQDVHNNNNNTSSSSSGNRDEGPILQQWTNFTSGLHNLISHAVVGLSRYSARHPQTVLVTTTVVAFCLVPLGYVTNFSLEVEQEAILAPFHSLARDHFDWIEGASGFPESTRPFDLLIHRDGDNVLTVDTILRAFEALTVFSETPGYAKICAAGDYETAVTGETTCRIHAATRFWWHNLTLFDEQVTTDQELREILSADEYPLGTPVGDHDFILGNYETFETLADDGDGDMMDNNHNNTTHSGNMTANKTLVSAQSYIIRIDLPVVDTQTSAFEDLVTEKMLKLRQAWADDSDNPVRLELFTFRSIPNEFMRAILLDLPLYPAVFFIMVSFACLAFFRRDRVHSRCLLGFGSVCTIGLSLMTGE